MHAAIVGALLGALLLGALCDTSCCGRGSSALVHALRT